MALACWLTKEQAQALQNIVDYISQDDCLAQDYLDMVDEGIDPLPHLWADVSIMVNAIDGTDLTPTQQAEKLLGKVGA